MSSRASLSLSLCARSQGSGPRWIHTDGRSEANQMRSSQASRRSQGGNSPLMRPIMRPRLLHFWANCAVFRAGFRSPRSSRLADYSIVAAGPLWPRIFGTPLSLGCASHRAQSRVAAANPISPSSSGPRSAQLPLCRSPPKPNTLPSKKQSRSHWPHQKSPAGTMHHAHHRLLAASKHPHRPQPSRPLTMVLLVP